MFPSTKVRRRCVEVPNTVTRRNVLRIVPLLLIVLLAASVASSSAFGSQRQAQFKKPDIWISNLVPINTATLNYPVLQESMKVYQKWINARGGIAGHRLQIF